MLKQLSVFTENSKGTFQSITGLLEDAGINIWGSTTNGSAEFGIIRLIVSDPEAARQLLEQSGFLCRSNSILGVELFDEVGSLNHLLVSLAESNVNVDYTYLSFNRTSGMPVMVIHTDSIWEVEECLKAKGYSLI
ncbi:MAG: amino acid-binding protein [Clostridiales bacterium]|nr:amino acid-binding protein [Clostridiales bacterium]